MTITVSINTVGIIRATNILQSARNEAMRSADDTPQTKSVEIGRSLDAELREAESDRIQTPSQNRAVDIWV